MSLKGYFDDLITRQPFGSTDATAANGAYADQANMDITQEQLSQGKITADQYAQIQQDWTTNADTSVQASTDAVTSGLAEGAADGARNLGNLAGQVVAGSSNLAWLAFVAFLKKIPWFVWGGLVIALFIWMGGLGLLASKTRNRLNT